MTHHMPVIPSVQAEHDKPPAEKVISGAPDFTTWNLVERDDLYCGLWQSTPGKWNVSYDEWEYFNILSGHSILTPDGEDPIHLTAGSRHIIEPGFKGTWEVIETTLKDYVIKT